MTRDETRIPDKLAYGSLPAAPDPGGTRDRGLGQDIDVHKRLEGYRSVPKPRMMGDYAVLCNVRVNVLNHC